MSARLGPSPSPAAKARAALAAQEARRPTLAQRDVFPAPTHDRIRFDRTGLADEQLLRCQAVRQVRVATYYRGRHPELRSVCCGEIALACEAVCDGDELRLPCGHDLHRHGVEAIEPNHWHRPLVPQRWWDALAQELCRQRPSHLRRITLEQIRESRRVHSRVGVWLVPLLAIGPREKVAAKVLALIGELLAERGVA